MDANMLDAVQHLLWSSDDNDASSGCLARL